MLTGKGNYQARHYVQGTLFEFSTLSNVHSALRSKYSIKVERYDIHRGTPASHRGPLEAGDGKLVGLINRVKYCSSAER